MDLSIIVPVYNVEEYVRPCLESIFKQDLDDSRFEVIIVNDGSTDRSMEMIADIIQAHSNITVINQENLSLSVARNNGIAVAKGEYIIMPDSDDLLTENSLSILLDKALETKADIVEANYLIMNNQEIDELSNGRIEQPNMLFRNMTSLESLNELKACYVWNKLFRRSFIIDNHLSFIPGIRFQDIPFTHECYLKATKCIKTNLILNVYRRGHFSASAPNFFNMEKAHDLCTAIAATWELTKSEGITPEARKAIIKSLLATYYNLIYRLLKYINKVTDRVKILRFLYTLAPDLRFSNNIKQRIGSWFSRKAPRQYLAIISVRWKKNTGDGFLYRCLRRCKGTNFSASHNA